MRLHLVLLFSCAALFGQSSIPPSSSVFHINGKVMQCGKEVRNLVGLAVAFEGSAPRTVKVNAAGVYSADLPVGIWTATAVPSFDEMGRDRGISRPRRFRARARSRVVINIFLRPPIMCDVSIVTPGGRPATPKEVDDRDAGCYEEEYYAVPSDDGVPFELDLGGLHKDMDPCSINRNTKKHREFATYNLLTVQADNVVYDSRLRILKASGNVVIQDESGEHKKNRARFEIWNGQARPLQ